MSSIRLSHLGLSEWESEFVKTTVRIASGLDISSWSFLEDAESADVLLVPDNQGTDADLPNLQSFETPESTLPIRLRFERPITYTFLIAALRDVEEQVRIGRAKRERRQPAVAELPATPEIPELTDVVKAPPADSGHEARGKLDERFRPARRFVEGTRFLGLVYDVLRRGRTTEITHPEYPSVTFFPGEGAYTSLGDPIMLPAMFRASALEFFRREIGDVIASVMLTIDQRRPLFQLVYCAALFGSEGRLFPHADPDELLFLVEEPEFASIPYTTEHRNIARQMLDGPATLTRIAEMTGTGIATVVDFCNACEATGLIRRGEARGALAEAGEERADISDSQLLGQVRHLFQSP